MGFNSGFKGLTDVLEIYSRLLTCWRVWCT